MAAQAYTVAKHTAAGVRSGTEIVQGDAATVLLTAAAEGQLVVLGKSTTGSVDEWVMARIAVRVAARSPATGRPRPAAARRDGGRPPGRGRPGPGRSRRRRAGGRVRGGGGATGRRRADPAADPGDPDPAPDGWTDDDAEWAQRFPGLEVRRSDLPRATAAQVLAATCPAPLIVLTAGHGTVLHRDLDGPHLWLLRHCTSPLALVPPVHRPELDPSEEIIALG